MELFWGDCIEVMRREFEDETFDSIVCDPPYNLGFMGKDWDTVENFEEWCREWGMEALRVAKDGAYLVAFGGTRTYHRLACGLEDAGWEIKDSLMWVYGSGFPKHKTKLKPAYEPIVLARKPAKKATPLNIDDCRIEAHNRPARDSTVSKSGLTGTGGAVTYGSFESQGSVAVGTTDQGRWPANIILDEEAGAILDEQSGNRKAGGKVRGTEPSRTGQNGIYGTFNRVENSPYDDEGGASRFFYCSKASKSEREAGLEDFEARTMAFSHGGQKAEKEGIVGTRGDHNGLNTVKVRKNTHATVKPISLMRWLTKLVTPKGGLILDPFLGSGTTGIAAALEGFEFVGIDSTEEYIELSRARIEHWSKQDH